MPKIELYHVVHAAIFGRCNTIASGCASALHMEVSTVARQTGQRAGLRAGYTGSLCHSKWFPIRQNRFFQESELARMIADS